MDNEKTVTHFFRSMQDLSKEVNQMEEERQREDPRRICDEESTSYQQKIRPKNPRYPHRSTMPTLFEEGERYINEERNEPETHETLSLYLKE